MLCFPLDRRRKRRGDLSFSSLIFGPVFLSILICFLLLNSFFKFLHEMRDNLWRRWNEEARRRRRRRWRRWRKSGKRRDRSNEAKDLSMALLTQLFPSLLTHIFPSFLPFTLCLSPLISSFFALFLVLSSKSIDVAKVREWVKERKEFK